MSLPPDGSANLFAYGTLMFPEIVEVLIGRVPQMQSARLGDHRRGRIEKAGRIAIGPGLVPLAGHHVDGMLLFDLTARELAIFDLFEDSAKGYRATSGIVLVRDSACQVAAKFYVATDDERLFITEEDWSPDAFRRDGLGALRASRIPALKKYWIAAGSISVRLNGRTAGASVRIRHWSASMKIAKRFNPIELRSEFRN